MNPLLLVKLFKMERAAVAMNEVCELTTNKPAEDRVQSVRGGYRGRLVLSLSLMPWKPTTWGESNGGCRLPNLGGVPSSSEHVAMCGEAYHCRQAPSEHGGLGGWFEGG